MQIECPSCTRSYAIRPSALGDGGRAVVCSFCQTRWFVSTPAQISSPARAEPIATEVGRRSQPGSRPDTRRGGHETARRKTKPVRRVHPAWSFALATACVALAMGLIGGRVALVRAVPRLAGVYAVVGLPVNVRGLEFADVQTVRSDDDGKTNLAISGTIRNIVHARTSVPRMTFDIRDGLGATIASWTEGAPKPSLGGAEAVTFTAHAPSLPVNARDVVVRFADANEAAGTHDHLLVKR